MILSGELALDLVAEEGIAISNASAQLQVENDR